MKKFFCSLLFAAAVAVLCGMGVWAQEYYVDAATGKDRNSGTETEPFATIQKAADIVKPGDTVIIGSGIYYENVKITTCGTEDAPIVFRAKEFGEGKTIITGADKRIRENKNKNVWELYDEEKNIYRTKLERNNMLMRFTYNGQDIYMYPTYEGLETYVTIPTENANYLAGYKHGYYMDCDNGWLYVRLREDEKYGSVNPNENLMVVSSQRYLDYTDEKGVVHAALQASAIHDDSYNIGVITENPAHIVIYGITFEAPGFTGVFVRGSDVTVSNCWFRTCTCCVKGGSRYMEDKYITKNVTIEYCDYTQMPSFEDAMELLEENKDNPVVRKRVNYWFLKKVTNSVVPYLSATYSYESGGFAGSMGENWVLRNNYVHDCFEGMSWYSNWVYSKMYKDGISMQEFSGKNHKFYENRFENCVDNLIELECNVNGYEVYNNEFVNAPDSISSQCQRGEPFSTNIYIHHNLIYNTYDWVTKWYPCASTPGVEWSKMPNFFKLGVRSAEYKSPSGWMKNQPWNYEKDAPLNTVRWSDSGMKIYNNTIYGPYTYMFNCIGFFAIELSDENVDHNVDFKNNIISVMSKYEEAGTTRQWMRVGDSAESRGGFSYAHNVFIPYRDDKKPENSHMFIEPNADDPLFGNGGKLIKNIEDAGMTDPENYKFELKENSPAIGAGEQIPWEKTDTTDAGAIPYGKSWHINYAPRPFGDINCDGKIDAADVSQLTRLLNVKKDDETFKSRADMDFNGVIDEKDMELLLKELAGKEGK